MPHYLLTGAGFSRNWGGWLADEAFEYLLGCSDITAHQRNLLWKHRTARTGFEGVLQELRDVYLAHRDVASARELQTFDTLLIGMFDAMNTGFGDFEPGRHERLGPQPTFVRDFLCRFDAIFTLNQDTLLEQKYQRSDFLDGSRGRWFGSESPGLQQETVAGTPYAPPGVFRPHEPPFIVRDRYQPYFKLHGSSNWRVLNGSTLLILGQNKGADIDNIALLDWYRGQFREMLSQPGAHLMIIGYSFRDPHINEIIYQGTSKGAKLFIIHPEGVGILDKAPPLPGRTRALVEEFQECIIGASRRPFLSNFGSDTVELKKILRFFPQFP